MNSNIDKLHGDEHIKFLTPQEEVAIERRVAEMVQERLRDHESFADIIAAIDPLETNSHLHRALCNLDAACKGEQIAINAILNALCHIQRRVHVEAVETWTDELREFADKELHNA
jgi:hypothetical protein